MKICVIGLTYPFRGGIAHYTTRLCEELKKRHDVKLFSFKRLYPGFIFPGTDQKDVESKEQFSFESVDSLDVMNPVTWVRTALKINREKPDIVLFQWWNPIFAPMYFLMKVFLKPETAFLCHNVFPHERTLVDRMLLKLGFFRTKRFLATCEQDIKDLKGLKKRVKVGKVYHPVYNIFNFGKIGKSQAKKKLGLSGNVLLFFGLVRPYKGLEYAIRAMPHVLKDMDATLLIAGEFYEGREKYEALIKELGLAGKIRIEDKYIPNEEVGYYITASDILVLPYTGATQSGIVQLAYAFDKPVVVTDVGGLPEVVFDGETGYVVPARDEKKIAGAVVKYYKENREKEFTANISKKKKMFSWEAVASKVEEVAK